MNKIFATLLFFSLISLINAQNVGIGTTTPFEKLHVNGNVQIDGLASSDSNVVLSNFDGKLINLNSGQAGEVLTSRGQGSAPIWAVPGAIPPPPADQSKIHFLALTGAPSVTCNTSSASSMTLLTHTFTPANDTVIFNFSSEGRVSSSWSFKHYFSTSFNTYYCIWIANTNLRHFSIYTVCNFYHLRFQNELKN
jgi:hypothetical protein